MQLKVYNNGIHFFDIRLKTDKAEIEDIRGDRGYVTVSDVTMWLSPYQEKKLIKAFGMPDTYYNVRLYF